MFRFIYNFIKGIFKSVLSCFTCSFFFALLIILVIILLPTRCGAATLTTSSKLTSMSISFDGDISMNYYFQMDNAFYNDKANYAKVVVASEEDEIIKTATVAEMDEMTNDDGDLGIKVSIPAKLMGANVTIGLYNSDDTCLKSYSGASSQNYNAAYYAKVVIDDDEDIYPAELEDMARAMLTYGAESQKLFDYNKNAPVNKGYELKDAMTDPASITGAIYDETEEETGITWQKVGAYADSLTKLRVYFLTEDYVTSVKIDGSDVSVSASDCKKEYYIDLQVSAQNLKRSYTIEATTKGAGSSGQIKTSQIKLNAYFVIKELLKGTSANVVSTADALYKFGRYADTYFSKNIPVLSLGELAVKTGYAYYEKHAYVQYDMKTAYYKSSTNQSRRQMYTSPEDLSEYKSYYMDCSSFCFNVYREIIGEENTINLLNSSKFDGGAKRDNFRTQYLSSVPNPKAVVKSYTNLASDEWYSDGTSATATTNWKNTVTDAKKYMQAGDLFVYYGYNSSGTSGGHILLWTGRGFLHCTGGSFNADNGTDAIEPSGAIYYIASGDFTYTYLKKHGASRAVIIRPSLVYDEGDITAYGEARTALGSLSATLLATDDTSDTKLCDGQSVAVGDELYYNIDISNTTYVGNVATDKRLRVTATMPSGVEIDDANEGAYIKGNTVVWDDVSLAKNGERTLSVYVRVKSEDFEAGSYLGSASASIVSLTAGKDAQPIIVKSQDVCCEDKVDSSTISKIKALSTGYASYKSKGTAGITIVNKVLSDATGKTVSLASSDSELFYSAFKDGSASNYYVKYSKKSSIEHLVGNFAAGLYVYNTSATDGDFSYQNAVRYISEDNLKIGDVIQAYDGSEYIYYIYIGNNKLMLIDGGVTSITSLSNISSETEKGIASKLFAKKAFAIFRALGR